MRVLYIVPEAVHFGGIETYCREWIAGVAERGITVQVIPINPDQILASLGIYDYVPHMSLLERFYFWKQIYFQDYRFHNAIRRLVLRHEREWRPDVVHVMHLFLGSILRHLKTPNVVSCYGLDVTDIPPVRTALRWTDTIHTISRFTLGLVSSIDATLASKACTLSWGIKRVVDPADAAPPEFDLVTVGRLVRRKNVDTVLRALASLPEVRYGIAGDGPELENLRELARTLHLTNVTFMGSVSEDEKWRIMQRSRAFVMCPRNDNPHDVEGLGLVYYEAQACGIPAIGANSGGAPEAIGRGGLVVEDPLNVVEVREAIRNALEPSRNQRLRCEVANRQQYESWDAFISRVLDLYNSLALGVRRKHPTQCDSVVAERSA